MINVFVADDHALIREALRVFLEMQPDIKVVGEAVNGNEAVKQVIAIKPDIVVMDISMPELNGIEATRKIIQSCPGLKVIILSMLGTSEHVYQALKAGAQGYLLKNSASQEIVSAVYAVYAGRRYFSDPVTDLLVVEYMQKPAAGEEKSPLEYLSDREREIMNHVLAGKSSAEIGRILFLSPKTVETYRSRMMRKLGMKDLPSLIKFAIREGLIL